MRLILRIAGTWALGLALVLIVVDGTKSLAADQIVLTSLADYWGVFSPDSLAFVQEFFATRLFAELLAEALSAVLSWPAFVVAGVPGMVLALLGRRRQPYRLVTSDQI